MFEKIVRIVFVVLFLSMLAVPLVTTNLQEEKISEAEKRKLAPHAKIINEDGTINGTFTSDFEKWINDNIGMRSQMVVNNARIQYYVFKVLANNSEMYLGPKSELNYATPAMIKNYQHINLYSEDILESFADSMQYISDYVERDGAQFYYYQCWDKHSVYPEYFPKTIIQTGNKSKTDGMVDSLINLTNVKVISPKAELIAAKEKYETYSVWGDPTHWSPRGAYIGYKILMENINSNSEKPYKVLQDSDYNITVFDQGSILFGGIHEVDNIETFEIRNPAAVLTKDKLTLYSEDNRHLFYTNNEVDNDTRLLIIGDSYFGSFFIDDLAESFHEVVLIWGDYLSDVKSIIDAYDADIVVIEAAERVDRSKGVISGAANMREAELDEQ